jgi:hypothetical protein
MTHSYETVILSVAKDPRILLGAPMLPQSANQPHPHLN